MQAKEYKIAVVMGGPSKEREISLNTGNAILAALKSRGYDAVGIDLEPSNFAQQIATSGAQVVFNAVHGLYGEDGRMQGMLEMLGIPYTGSGVLASAITMNKVYSKLLFRATGVPTPKYVVVHKEDESLATLHVAASIGLPAVVKAASQGSSIGTTVVREASHLQDALADAFQYDTEVVVEEFIQGKELTVCIMPDGGEACALPVINIVPHSGQYDYHSKYTKGATEYLVPAPLDLETTVAVQQAGLAAYKAAGCKGVARTDVMLSEDGKPYVLEVNSVPGMTATSLVPKAAAARGYSFADLCEKILLEALR